MPERRALLENWLRSVLDRDEVVLAPASGDASFRRYWRLGHEGTSYIAMDAPPGQEDTDRFVRLARAWRDLGLRTPEIYWENPQQGFLLLEDFGSRLYLDHLDGASADRLYGDALGALVIIQACATTVGLPSYDDAFLRREMALFQDWLVERHLGLVLTAQEEADLKAALAFLAASAQEQPVLLAETVRFTKLRMDFCSDANRSACRSG